MLDLFAHLSDGGLDRVMADAPVIDLGDIGDLPVPPEPEQPAKEESLEGLCNLLSQQVLSKIRFID